MYLLVLYTDDGHAGKEQLVCIPNHWRCLDNLKCIAESSRCNGIYDCQDHSDEKYCEEPGFTRPPEIGKEGNIQKHTRDLENTFCLHLSFFTQLALLLLLAHQCYLNLCNLFSVTCCYTLYICLLILDDNLYLHSTVSSYNSIKLVTKSTQKTVALFTKKNL